MKAYDIELRKRIIQYYERTQAKLKTCQLFSISRPTLDRWLAQQATEGHFHPRPSGWQQGYGHKVTDLAEFKRWLVQQRFDRIVDLVPLFEQHYGVSISERNLGKWLERAHWSRKKRP